MSQLLCLMLLFAQVQCAEVRVFTVLDGTIAEVGGGATSNLRRLLKTSHSSVPTHSSLVAGEVQRDMGLDDTPEEAVTKPKTVFRELPDRFRLSIEPRFGRYSSVKDFSVSVIGTTLQVIESRYMGYGLKLDYPLPTTPDKISLPPHVLLAPDGSIQISVIKLQSAQESQQAATLSSLQQATLSSLFAAPQQAGPGVHVGVLPADFLALFAAAAQNNKNVKIITTAMPNSQTAAGTASTTTTSSSSSSSSSSSTKSSSGDKAKKTLDAYESIRKAMSKKEKPVEQTTQSRQKIVQTRGNANIVAPPE